MLGVGKQRPYAKCGQNIPCAIPGRRYGKAPYGSVSGAAS